MEAPAGDGVEGEVGLRFVGLEVDGEAGCGRFGGCFWLRWCDWLRLCGWLRRIGRRWIDVWDIGWEAVWVGVGAEIDATGGAAGWQGGFAKRFGNRRGLLADRFAWCDGFWFQQREGKRFLTNWLGGGFRKWAFFAPLLEWRGFLQWLRNAYLRGWLGFRCRLILGLGVRFRCGFRFRFGLEVRLRCRLKLGLGFRSWIEISFWNEFRFRFRFRFGFCLTAFELVAFLHEASELVLVGLLCRLLNLFGLDFLLNLLVLNDLFLLFLSRCRVRFFHFQVPPAVRVFPAVP